MPECKSHFSQGVFASFDPNTGFSILRIESRHRHGSHGSVLRILSGSGGTDTLLQFMIDPSQDLLIMLLRNRQTFAFVFPYALLGNESTTDMVTRVSMQILALDGTPHPVASQEPVWMHNEMAENGLLQMYILGDYVSVHYPGDQLWVIDWKAGKTKLVRLSPLMVSEI
jgi:hypothetical protein